MHPRCCKGSKGKQDTHTLAMCPAKPTYTCKKLGEGGGRLFQKSSEQTESTVGAIVLWYRRSYGHGLTTSPQAYSWGCPQALE